MTFPLLSHDNATFNAAVSEFHERQVARIDNPGRDPEQMYVDVDMLLMAVTRLRTQLVRQRKLMAKVHAIADTGVSAPLGFTNVHISAAGGEPFAAET